MLDINESIETRILTLWQQVEENSMIIENIVDSLVGKYNTELEEFIAQTSDLLADGEHTLTDDELEAVTLKIPIFMYFTSSGLEDLGVGVDSAKAVRLDAFDSFYVAAEGTIQDKTKVAQLNTFPEYLVEIAFQRAYKKLKVQLDMAEHIFSGVKKIITKRIAELELSGRELNYHQSPDTASRPAPVKEERESF